MKSPDPALSELKKGMRVLIMDGHPWAGHVGYIVSVERISVFKGKWPKVRSEVNGQEFFVMNPDQIKLLKDEF